MNPTVSDDVEWYIFENFPASVPPVERPVRLGPFACEEECRALLESIKQIPRFGHGNLEVHKKQRRREPRIDIKLPVYLCPPAMESKSQLAHTVNISRSGARLTSLQKVPKPGEVFELRYGGRKALFRVVWVGASGTAIANDVGVQCLRPEGNIWNLNFPEPSAEDSLLREIEFARTVQTQLLPQEQPPLETLDYAGHCIQAHSVGGDYYDFLLLGPGQVAFVLADIAGKGLGSALLMANLQGSLHGFAPLTASDLSRLLSVLNRHFYRHSEKTVYLTGFFGCYNDETRKLRYVNCGHNPPLLLRQNGLLERLEPTATVLGLFHDWEGSVSEVQLKSGDILCIYSDGVTEATSATGEEFGEARLLQILGQNRSEKAMPLLRRVKRAVEQFSCGEQEDDLTVVIARAR